MRLRKITWKIGDTADWDYWDNELMVSIGAAGKYIASDITPTTTFSYSSD